MTSAHRDVAEHYEITDLESRLLDALRSAGKDPDALGVDDLAPVDAFHIRGRAATEELGRWAAIAPGDVVLDAGCGIGGTSRYLASTFGCRVVGVDLTDAYCRLAEALSGRVGLHERTSFRQGSVLDLPFEDGRFDVVWTEHVQMNIADKRRFYGELHRVLKPGGQLAFHDIFAGAADGLHLPVPWATDPSISHLVPVEDVRSLLAELGFDTVRWEDRTAESIAFFRSTLGRVEADGWMPLGLHLLMGEDATTKFTNVMRNLENDRIRVAQAVLARPGG